MRGYLLLGHLLSAVLTWHWCMFLLIVPAGFLPGYGLLAHLTQDSVPCTPELVEGEVTGLDVLQTETKLQLAFAQSAATLLPVLAALRCWLLVLIHFSLLSFP